MYTRRAHPFNHPPLKQLSPRPSLGITTEPCPGMPGGTTGPFGRRGNRTPLDATTSYHLRFPADFKILFKGVKNRDKMGTNPHNSSNPTNNTTKLPPGNESLWWWKELGFQPPSPGGFRHPRETGGRGRGREGEGSGNSSFHKVPFYSNQTTVQGQGGNVYGRQFHVR